MKTELGSKVQDIITGFSGVVTGRAEYISGCNQALVVPAIRPDGALPDSQWFDEQRLSVVDESKIVLDNGNTPGCDKPAPRR